MDIAATTEPRSDQQNFDDYQGGPRTVTISEVRAGSTDQPVELHLAEYPGRPYKPSKSMRRVLVAAWGSEAEAYVGRRMKLVGDPTVKFGGSVVGGIKIAALSNMDKRLTISLTVTKGKRAPHTVDVLPDEPTSTPAPKPLATQIADMLALYESTFAVTTTQLEAHVALPTTEWTTDTLDALRVLGGELNRGEKNVGDEFPGVGRECGWAKRRECARPPAAPRPLLVRRWRRRWI